jgi:hypothetical protein
MIQPTHLNLVLGGVAGDAFECQFFPRGSTLHKIDAAKASEKHLSISFVLPFGAS